MATALVKLTTPPLEAQYAARTSTKMSLCSINLLSIAEKVILRLKIPWLGLRLTSTTCYAFQSRAACGIDDPSSVSAPIKLLFQKLRTSELAAKEDAAKVDSSAT